MQNMKKNVLEFRSNVFLECFCNRNMLSYIRFPFLPNFFAAPPPFVTHNDALESKSLYRKNGYFDPFGGHEITTLLSYFV